MKCPYCHGHAKVVDTRLNGIGIRRRYDCGAHRFTTYLMERTMKCGRAKIMVELLVEDQEEKAALAAEADQGMATVARGLQKVFGKWTGRRHNDDEQVNYSLTDKPPISCDAVGAYV